MQIFKYQLDLADEQIVRMPRGAKILTVQMQGFSPYLWAVVDITQPTEERWIATRGTGHMFEGDPGVYLGTVQLHNGLVFHVFDATGQGQNANP